jgi:hypothetical protein
VRWLHEERMIESGAATWEDFVSIDGTKIAPQGSDDRCGPLLFSGLDLRTRLTLHRLYATGHHIYLDRQTTAFFAVSFQG